ncbi:MAG: 2-amino-4-hydroxy-6-hydroxymethyldihydropteridine diphosphokinase [Gammaproteobacteria bacterium]|nr:MAG: 2-amino-4-hydroxy-6-hydroxymethyldihydropteridine diphosphokinase [Gammaproteobacteria bacterium]
MAQVYVSIGSNIERRQHIESALRMLAERFGPLVQSSIYECAAVGFESAPFYNLVVGFETNLSPGDVREHLRVIEDCNGRDRSADLGARTLDLDILLYDDLVADQEEMVLPRPDIARYAFVLGPLAEIAGSLRHPVTGKRLDEMWSEFGDESQALKRVDWKPPAMA